MIRRCDDCGIHIPDNKTLWEYTINEEIQTEITEYEKEQFGSSVKLLVDTPYSAVLRSFCEDCAQKYDLHQVWIPDIPRHLRRRTYSENAPEDDPKHTCLRCRKCGDIVLLGEPYWAVMLFKGYYEHLVFEHVENYVIYIFCSKCSEIKDFNRMDVQRIS